MVNKTYDAVIIGAGSVGVPTAFFLTLEGLKVLVLESRPSVGQGENKAAIGGVRATHSDPAKILICQDSLRIFAEWQETYGHNIGWKKGGYCFPVYNKKEEQILKSILPIQKSYGLRIDWYDAHDIKSVIPGILPEGLMGGTVSPDDGQVSPLLALDAIFRVSQERGCAYRFRESVSAFLVKHGRVRGVKTDKGTYYAPVIVNAAGARAGEVGKLAGIDVPVIPDSHEAGISAPMKPFLGPLVVDLRTGPEGKTSNFYFGQNSEGAVIFCYTPIKPFFGTNREPTSEFLPILARRMISLLPRLKNMLVRRVWRGLYPMTPDGLPLCDRVREVEGLYLAVGMCGQGFMMGPGVGRNVANLIVHGSPLIAPDIFATLSFYRDSYGSKKEALK
jgi:sarcosine oxidase subunit beta